FFFVQAEDGIRDRNVTGVQTCALPICLVSRRPFANAGPPGFDWPVPLPTGPLLLPSEMMFPHRYRILRAGRRKSLGFWTSSHLTDSRGYRLWPGQERPNSRFEWLKSSPRVPSSWICAVTTQNLQRWLRRLRNARSCVG